MKKAEKWWLGLSLLFYALYNLPCVPAYGDEKGLLLHAALTLIPLWLCIYVGLRKVFRAYKLRDEKKEED